VAVPQPLRFTDSNAFSSSEIGVTGPEKSAAERTTRIEEVDGGGIQKNREK